MNCGILQIALMILCMTLDLVVKFLLDGNVTKDLDNIECHNFNNPLMALILANKSGKSKIVTTDLNFTILS